MFILGSILVAHPQQQLAPGFAQVWWRVPMSLYPQVKTFLTATILGGAALLATTPAQASDLDDDFGPSYHRPRVEREVTITTVRRRYGYDRPVYGRPVYDDD